MVEIYGFQNPRANGHALREQEMTCPQPWQTTPNLLKSFGPAKILAMLSIMICPRTTLFSDGLMEEPHCLSMDRKYSTDQNKSNHHLVNRDELHQKDREKMAEKWHDIIPLYHGFICISTFTAGIGHACGNEPLGRFASPRKSQRWNHYYTEQIFNLHICPGCCWT